MEQNGMLGARAQAYNEGETVYCESVGEYTLPDYMPEIRKLLRIETRLLPTGRFLSGGRAEISGVCVHTVYYSDGEGHLSAAVESGDYRCAVPLAAEDAQVIPSCRVKGVTHRLGGPRRIGIRTAIEAQVAVLPREAIGECEGCEGCETLHGREEVCERVFLSHDGVTLSDISHVDGVMPSEVRPISTDASVHVREVRLQESGALCTGEVWVRVLYAVCTGGAGEEKSEMPDVLLRKIPFDLQVEGDGLSGFVPHGYCSSVDAAFEDDGLGGCELNVTVRLCMEGEGICTHEVAYLRDAYARNARTDTVKKTLPVARYLGTVAQNISVSEKHPLDEVMPSARAVTCALSVTESECSCDDGKLRVLLTCKAEGILMQQGEGGMPHYERVEFAFPVRAQLPMTWQACEHAEYSVHAEYLGGTLRTDGESVRLDGELALCVCALEKREIAYLERVMQTEDAMIREPHTLTVAYPEDGETLWTLSKRYRADLERVAHQNGIDLRFLDEPDCRESIDGMASLLIS